MSKDELIHKAIAAADKYAALSEGIAPWELDNYAATARRQCIEAIRAVAAEPVNGDTIQASAIAENQSMQIPFR